MSILQTLVYKKYNINIAYTPARYVFDIDNGDEVVYTSENDSPASYSFSINNGTEIIYVSENDSPASYSFSIVGT